jgi:hypothetical protein
VERDEVKGRYKDERDFPMATHVAFCCDLRLADSSRCDLTTYRVLTDEQRNFDTAVSAVRGLAQHHPKQ